MSIHVIPEMSPQELEKILKHLPEPTYVEISLFGDFDYSSILTQAEELMPGIKLKESGRQTFRLRNPSTENILDIYRKLYGLKNPIQPTKVQSLSCEEALAEGEKEGIRQRRIDLKVQSLSCEEALAEGEKEGIRQRRIDLDKACWYLDDHVRIELTPWEVNIKYNGQEPKYISQMRRELSGTNVRIGIEINK